MRKYNLFSAWLNAKAKFSVLRARADACEQLLRTRANPLTPIGQKQLTLVKLNKYSDSSDL